MANALPKHMADRANQAASEAKEAEKRKERARQKAKSNDEAERITAADIHAEGTVTPEARQHADFMLKRFTERDKDGGEMEGSRMVRIAPIRPLDGLAKKNPKAEKPYLSEVEVLAAHKYHALVEAAQCKLNHEIQEQVDKSPNPDGRMVAQLTANDVLARIHMRMPMDYRCMADLLFIKFPDMPMNAIWPNRTLRNISKEIIKDTLAWLSVEFGDASN